MELVSSQKDWASQNSIIFVLKLGKKLFRNVSEEKLLSLLCDPELKNLKSKSSQTLIGKMKKIHDMSPCPQNHSTFTTDKNNNWHYWRTYFVFQSAELLVGWDFFRLKQTSFSWEPATLRQLSQESWARSATQPSRPFPSRHQSSHLKCLYLTLATETLLDQSRTAEPAHRQFWDSKTFQEKKHFSW